MQSSVFPSYSWSASSTSHIVRWHLYEHCLLHTIASKTTVIFLSFPINCPSHATGWPQFRNLKCLASRLLRHLGNNWALFIFKNMYYVVIIWNLVIMAKNQFTMSWQNARNYFSVSIATSHHISLPWFNGIPHAIARTSCHEVYPLFGFAGGFTSYRLHLVNRWSSSHGVSLGTARNLWHRLNTECLIDAKDSSRPAESPFQIALDV